VSAARLRRVGNRGVLVDPAHVAAVYRITRPHGVVVELASGSRITVFDPYRIEGRSTGAATPEDADEVSDVTRANDLANLRGFYRWCQLFEHRVDDPSLRLERPKIQPGLPRGVTPSELQAILAAVAEAEDHISRRAIVLGAYAGLRISESAALPWSEVDVAHRRIRVVKSKGGKSRVVAVAPELLTMLGRPCRGGTVVTGAEPMTVDNLRHRVNRAIQAAGVEATSHQLRHYYGTQFYRATRDLVATGKQLGHASVSTTQIYAAAADEVADAGAAAVVVWTPPDG
jgi:integrase/recombinase XerD